MTSDLAADDFVLLADEVLEGRDDDGRAIDLLLDIVRGGRHRELFDTETVDTVLWAIGYGLASIGSWRIIELARSYHRHERRSLTTVSLLAWSAHVASLHLHDGLAWRLASAAERLLDALPTVDDSKRQGVMWQLYLIRSGCRMREADRWRSHDFWGNASQSLNEAGQFIRHAEQAALGFEGSSALSKAIGSQLRRAEILWVAHLMRVDGHPAQGFENELGRFEHLLDRLDELMTEADKSSLDVGDQRIFHQRLNLLRAAHRDFLDDLPPDSPTA